MQVELEFLPIENIQVAKARDQTGFLDVLHLLAQLTALENLAAFESNFGNAHTWPFSDLKGDCIRGCRYSFDGRFDRRIWMTLRGQHFFQNTRGVSELDWVFNRFF